MFYCDVRVDKCVRYAPPVMMAAISVGSIVFFASKSLRTASCGGMMALAKPWVESALPLIVRSIFLVYPLVTNAAFEGLSCCRDRAV